MSFKSIIITVSLGIILIQTIEYEFIKSYIQDNYIDRNDNYFIEIQNRNLKDSQTIDSMEVKISELHYQVAKKDSLIKRLK